MEPGEDTAQETTASLRQRKKWATRHAIGAAALRLALERGLDGLLVSDIAAEANVSPRTFNNYFSSKYEAICSTGLDRSRQVGDELRRRPLHEPLWEALVNALLSHYDVNDVAPTKGSVTALWLLMSSPAIQSEYLKVNATMQHILAEAIADRVGLNVERDMFPMILAGAVTATSQVALQRWFEADPPTRIRPLLRKALGQLATACSSQAAA
jgi:AcrR family transcriptional regulator